MSWFARLSLCCCLLASIACADGESDDMTQPPWALWGQTKTVELVSIAGQPYQLSSLQLVNINYRRPETWHWLFVVDVLESESTGQTGVVQVRWDLTTGIGQTSSTIRDFEFFYWGTLPLVGQQAWSNRVLQQYFGPPPNPDLLTSWTDEIVGQDIQVKVNCLLTGQAARGTRVALQVSAYMAPATHVRPEWHIGDFPGAEDGRSNVRANR